MSFQMSINRERNGTLMVLFSFSKKVQKKKLGLQLVKKLEMPLKEI
jgi:hypothetical protein